jgi:ABC-2 type transport system ATP-binding protein
MSAAVEFRGVTKRYGATVALDDVTLAVPRRSITGLVGRNGSGKTTLLRHATGLLLPDAGECVTLGRGAAELGRAELSRIGAVHQDDPLLGWMTAGQLLQYVASFHERWDRELERSLLATLELDARARVGAMSPGTRQKLALVLATCHHPELLLLDEPLSDLDPIARQAVLAALLERFSSDDMTIIISSHMLRDIEPVVDRIVCLHEGRVTADDALDDLKERFAEWVVTSAEGRLPERFDEPYVVSSRGDRHRARLVVRDAGGAAGRAEQGHAAGAGGGAAAAAELAARHGATVEVRPLNLEALFPLLVNGAAVDVDAAAGGARSGRLDRPAGRAAGDRAADEGRT